MKLKIKVKVLSEGCMPEITEKGDWIDLKSATDISLNAPQVSTQYTTSIGEKHRDAQISTVNIPLGIAIELPKGFEAIVASRSSNPSKLRVFIPNGIGVIDNCYNGNEDQWYYILSPMTNTLISKGMRICQFRIQLSQKATLWQKLKWLFSSGIELIQVDSLNKINRGGIGSTGSK